MSEDATIGSAVYDEAAGAIKLQLEEGKDVVFLCEGDPLFFGSFAYLLTRIQDEYPCEVIPGIASPHGASAKLDEEIRQALLTLDSLVIMKAGRARSKILRLLNETNRLHQANYLEYIGRENECIVEDVSTLAQEAGPYFSLFIVLRDERGRS